MNQRKHIINLLVVGIWFLISSKGIAQNVWIIGKATDYYSHKKIKNVDVSIHQGDTLLSELHSKGSLKIPIHSLGVHKVSFRKEGYIDKFFLISTSDLPKYYLNKKFKIKVDVSLAVIDKIMEDNTLENAVGYIYFNPKYKEFIWDAEYTKRAQIAMDAQIFPLDEVVKLDSSMKAENQSLFYQRGINYYANMQTKPNQWFLDSEIIQSNSKIKAPVIQGYLYGKFTHYLLKEELERVNTIRKEIGLKKENYNDLGEALQDCKRLDTLILNNKYAAVGYWINLSNYSDTTNIEAYTNTIATIQKIAKNWTSPDMTDAELSFYSDLKLVLSSANKLQQKLNYLRPSEIKNPQFYRRELQNFGKDLQRISKNLGFVTD
ncbi:MAG: hypothetical protein KDC84_08275 [Crocinitomicaceae bacterium]|nr:hypothetical protein [Crocinitomicaceae bacterium]